MKELQIIFYVGGGFFAAAAIVALVWSAYLWWWRKRENPGHLVMWSCALESILYWALLVDWNVILRPDGVEAPWLRPAINVPVYLMLAWLLGTGLWMTVADTTFLVGLATIGGALLIGGDVAHPDRQWWWFSFGLAAMCAAGMFSMRRGQFPEMRSWGMWGGFLVMALGTPIVQSLSWTMSGTLDTSPQRKNSEIAYLVASGLGIAVNGCVSLLLWVPVQIHREPATLPPPSTTSDTILSSPVPPSQFVTSELRRRIKKE